MGAIRSGITQATASAEGTISAEGNIGKNKAQGSIDSEGIWDLGIDFKVGGLGITNDYGGAITVSIAGQSITWGREGGKIHYSLGGFELIVEARDCVVTETKKIMGIEVASHTYPDPGCELEPEPEPELPEPPPELGPDGGINLPDTEEVGWVIYNMRETYYQWGRIDNPTYNNTTIRTVSDIKEKDRIATSLPFKLVSTKNPNGATNYTYERDTAIHNSVTYTTSGNFGNASVVNSQKYPQYTFIWWFVAGFFGKVKDIKNFIELNKKNNETEIVYGLANRYTGAKSFYFYIPTAFIPLNPKPKTVQPFLKPGVPPHMNDCCEEILDTLEDLKDVLHVDFFKKKKFPVPTYLLAPGCEPGKTVDAENYYHLFQKMFQAIAHNTIVSPQIDIQDADAVKEGDQKINERYLSATGWAEAVTKMLYEIVDDGNIGTNMDIRTGVTVTQLMVAVADLSYKLDCVIDLIGIPTKRTKGEVETSYNLVLEGENTKGFDPKKSNQQLDLNTDISTEKLLSGLLRTRKNPIVKEEIHPKSPTLFEMFQKFMGK
ncbi:hypothetical protein [Microcoleus sp. Pol17_C1]|uniref:hypothetical protein n=1 Tax=unclassified Microcoleus TaxID=2642155 RepID=UPI002FD2CEB3